MAPPTHSIPVIGLVGGIGSGKSAVARWVAERRNMPVIDGDAAGHQALLLPEVTSQIRKHFGTEVFDDAGLVDRSALAKLVFGAGESHKQAKETLESIVHPVIRRVISETIDNLRTSKSPPEAILLDAAVLLEAGWENVCSAVIFIDTPQEQRQQRVAARGWSAEEFERREASQLPLSEKRSRADLVIPNDAELDRAGQQLEEIVIRLANADVSTASDAEPANKPNDQSTRSNGVME